LTKKTKEDLLKNPASKVQDYESAVDYLQKSPLTIDGE
jgi:hypothetical protein